MATTTPSPESDALRVFQETWTGELASDLGVRLTCGEVEALADLFTATGRPDLAAAWITEHSYGDDEGDSHYRADTP